MPEPTVAEQAAHAALDTFMRGGPDGTECARRIVAAVRPHIIDELCDRLAAEPSASRAERSGMENAVSILAWWADEAHEGTPP